MGGTLRHQQNLLQWRICSSKHGRWQMYAAHQWQVLEAVLPLKTSYIGSEWCLHGQSLFLGTCSSNPPLLEFSSLCWNFWKAKKQCLLSMFHCSKKNQTQNPSFGASSLTWPKLSILEPKIHGLKQKSGLRNFHPSPPILLPPKMVLSQNLWPSFL